MKTRGVLFVTAVAALLLGAFSTLFAGSAPAGVDRAAPAPLPQSTRLPLFGSLDDSLLDLAVLATATPAPAILRPFDSGILDGVLVTTLLEAAPTPAPELFAPGEIGGLRSARLGDELSYLRRVDDERLAAIGLERTGGGALDELIVSDVGQLGLLTSLTADANGFLGQPPPFVACNEAISLEFLGTVVAGAITEPGVPCAYTFEGRAGGHYSLSIKSTEFVPWLDVFDPDGNYLAPVTDVPGDDGMSLYRSYGLEDGGTYTVVIRPVDESATGGFELTIASLTTYTLMSANVCARSVDVGDTLADERLRRESKCFYSLPVAAGSRVTIAMNSPDGAIDPVLELNDPTGVEEARNDDARPDDTNSLILGHRIVMNGEYTIVARAFDDSQEGDFDLLVAAYTPPIPTPVPTAAQCTATIQYGTSVEWQHLATRR